MVSMQHQINNITPLTDIYITNWKQKQQVPLVDINKSYTLQEFENIVKQYGFNPIHVEQSLDYNKTNKAINDFPISIPAMSDTNIVPQKMVDFLNSNIKVKEEKTIRLFIKSPGAKINKNKKVLNLLGDKLHTSPDEDIQLAYKNVHAVQINIDNAAKAKTPLSKMTSDPLGKWELSLKDPSELFIQMDNWLQGYSNLSGIQSNILSGVDKANIDITAWRNRFIGLNKQASKVGLSPDDVSKYIESPALLENISDSTATRNVINEFRTFYSDIGEYINKNGGRVELRENYRHHTVKSQAEQRKYFADTYEQLKNKYGDPSDWEVGYIDPDKGNKLNNLHGCIAISLTPY
jgi:hypothetical protein